MNQVQFEWGEHHIFPRWTAEMEAYMHAFLEGMPVWRWGIASWEQMLRGCPDLVFPPFARVDASLEEALAYVKQWVLMAQQYGEKCLQSPWINPYYVDYDFSVLLWGKEISISWRLLPKDEEDGVGGLIDCVVIRYRPSRYRIYASLEEAFVRYVEEKEAIGRASEAGDEETLRALGVVPLEEVGFWGYFETEGRRGRTYVLYSDTKEGGGGR